MAACCNKPGCDVTWERDPCLEVACPTCQAKVGVICRRPSGHKIMGAFKFHPQRDLLADRLGHYGRCPLGSCGQPGTQLTLF